MINFIARRIKLAKDENDTSAGKAKYIAYFIAANKYENVRKAVDKNLKENCYADCIAE